METVITLLDVGDSPDDVSVHHVGDSVVIYVKTENKSAYRHVATITGVHRHIRRDKDYGNRHTNIVVDYGDMKENREKREVIATILHKKNLATIDEIASERPLCTICKVRRELVGGSVFAYVYRCPKCGDEITC